MIWGILYGPIQFGSDLLHGMVCGDPERLAHATTTYGLFVLGGVKASLDDLPPRSRTPHSDDPPNTVPPAKQPPRLPCVNSFSAGTLVSTADGLRPISTIRVGDLVLAYDEATRTT